MKGKIKLEESVLTQEDLAISFSRDEELLQKMKLGERGMEEGEEKTVRIRAKRVDRSSGTQGMSDVSSFLNSSAFQSCGSSDGETREEEETNKYSHAREYSENPVQLHIFGKAQKGSFLHPVDETKEDEGVKEKEEEFVDVVNDSRSSVSLNRPILKEETELRQRMRDLANNIRKCTVQRNRLKYLLRKDAQVEEESFETRQCPCCKKFISKLCFKCEHVYCNPQNCPRKKKQRLNARMLERMKGKKQVGEGKRKRQKKHSRSRDKASQKLKKSVGEIDDDDSQIDEDSLFDDDLSSDFEQSEQEETNPTTRPQFRDNDKAKPSWKLTMSDIAVDDSKLFMDSDEDK